MTAVKCYIQHRFNPLHVYCRLREYGLSTAHAFRLCHLYERWFYNPCMGHSN